MQFRLMVQHVCVQSTAAVVLFFVFASRVFAQGAAAVAQEFVDDVNTIFLFPLINLLLGIAIVIFLWGGFQYVANADNDSARQKGTQHLFWGVIGIMVMVSAKAILDLAAGTFEIPVP